MTDNLPAAYVNPGGRPHFAAAQAALRQADTDGRIDLATVLVRMLTPAGALSEWDSETIEQVLSQADSTLAAAGIETYGSYDTPDAHRYWANIAEDLGWHHDYEDDYEDPDDEDPEDEDTDA